MRIPNPPLLRPAQQISPSAYEQMIRCKARAAWSLFGDKKVIPQHPKSILGTCYHRTVEDAHAGRLVGLDPAARKGAAREAFDTHARHLHEGAHPLLRAKFSAPERLPYYNLFRERAALEAMSAAERAPRTSMDEGKALHLQTEFSESKLVTRDGLVAGRPDFVDAAARRIVDHKTGVAPSPGEPPISEAEARQLRLYAHLALENGIEITEGVIARSDGNSTTLAISRDEAAAEGRAARELLAEFNTEAGVKFSDVARPGSAICTYCPCIPFCEAFWANATPDWADECGIHVEGTVRSVEESTVQGIKLTTFGISAQRGTIRLGDAFVEQVPEKWITAGGGQSPSVDDLIRVVFARADSEGSVASVRIDRTSTSIWSRPTDQP